MPEETFQLQSERTPAFRGVLFFCSNMAPAAVGRFTSAEHAYVAAKTTNPRIHEMIAREISPYRVKRWGNPRSDDYRLGQIRPEWSDPAFRLRVMRAILARKFGPANPGLAAELVRTEGIALVERNTWGDAFWGQCGGEGENHLGQLLMERRRSLIRALRVGRLRLTGEKVGRIKT